MALERVPADIRAQGGVARMADPGKIREIQAAVSIPVMAKCRIGHFAEAQILQALGVDYIDESEVLTPADEAHHVDKHAFTVPFVCGCRDLGEALRRIGEGAAMIRTKGEAGTGNIVEAVRHMRAVTSAIRRLATLHAEELMAEAKTLGAPYELVRWVAENGKLPVPNFAAGGIATPADASLMMQLGAESVFVGSGIFKCSDPARRAQGDRARHHPLQGRQDPRRGLGGPRRADARASRPRACRATSCCRPAAGDGGQGRHRRLRTPDPRPAAGVLALQGDFAAHARALEACGAKDVREVRLPGELEGLSGLVMPGGESTTLLRLLREHGFDRALPGFLERGGAIYGTCAGAILLARACSHPSSGRSACWTSTSSATPTAGRWIPSRRS